MYSGRREPLKGTPLLCDYINAFRQRTARAGLWFRHYPDFETQLLYLLDNPEARDALGNNGREWVKNEYAWPVIEQKFLDALNALRP